jgi:DNA replication protein DnaC
MSKNPNGKKTNHLETMHERIQKHLGILGIPLTQEQLDQLVRRAETEHLSLLDFLDQVLALPATARQERSIARRIHCANFRDPGTFESFDWNFNSKTIDRATFQELGSGDFVRRRDNLVFAGESGLGKSHLMQSIGRRCCALGYRVRYVTSAGLLEDLTAASGDKTLPSRLRYYSRFDLLIIDEFGFDKLERLEYPEAPSLLYRVIDRRSRRYSTALVTNIDFDDWADYLGDPPLAMALLDRVVDGAILYKFKGKSYRASRTKRVSPKNGPDTTGPLAAHAEP